MKDRTPVIIIIDIKYKYFRTFIANVLALSTPPKNASIKSSLFRKGHV